MYTLMQHQKETCELYKKSSIIFDQSDAGTGKTLPGLHAWAERRRVGGGRLLIFAPKTCVTSVWINEVAKFYASEFTACAALAPTREPAFSIIHDITVINHDGVKWILKHTPKKLDALLHGYDSIIWDESDKIRHASARTKAAIRLSVRPQWKHKAIFSATPFNKSVAEMFFQTLFLDGGIRLGKSFYKFRSTICDPIQVGPQANHIQWADKLDAPAAIAGLLQDISVRHELDTCIDMPDIIHRQIQIDLPIKLRRAYTALRNESVLKLKSTDVVAVNAAVLASKLLQLCSGSIYSESGTHIIDTDRAELAMELAKASRPTVIFFNFKHQLQALIKQAGIFGLTYSFIDGSVNTEKRAHIVQAFQGGVFDAIFLQIDSASHGITLTSSHRAVFMTPPYSPSTYKQAFGRIYRKGQKHKCESILITANNTLEEAVVDTLISRKEKQDSLLDLLV